MKNLILVLFLFCCTSFSACAQKYVETIKQQPCTVPHLQAQADSLKNKYATDGFTLIRSAVVSVKNDHETPVVFMLEGGAMYEFIYVGEHTSKKYEVQLRYMQNGGLVANKKNLWADVDGPIVDFAYTPEMTQQFSAHLYQYAPGGKDYLCGVFMVLKKTKASVRQ